MIRNFRQMLEAKWAEGRFVCVGLDGDYKKIPETVKSKKHGVCSVMLDFNQAIIDATKDLAGAYKLNAAFYEAHGTAGMDALRYTIEYIRTAAPKVPVIYDAKRADIGNTNDGYVKSAFDWLYADAITVNPYFGQEALEPFLKEKDKGIIVLCRTSNKGASEFQDLWWDIGLGHPLANKLGKLSITLYQQVAYNVATHWNNNGNCALVVGATYPEELARVRQIVGDMPILIPGIGAQGGDLEKTVLAGKDSRGRGMIINSSRGIIFASSGADFAEATRHETQKLHNSINQCLKGGVR